MPTSTGPAAELLIELARRGVELRAYGERLRYRPRSALTPELAQRVTAQKPALLALLRRDLTPDSARASQYWPAPNAAPETGRVGQPDTPGSPGARVVPHEPSLAERIESGYVNPGWTARAWAKRLCQLADRCEALHPQLAAQYRTWAEHVWNNRKKSV